MQVEVEAVGFRPNGSMGPMSVCYGITSKYSYPTVNPKA